MPDRTGTTVAVCGNKVDSRTETMLPSSMADRENEMQTTAKNLRPAIKVHRIGGWYDATLINEDNEEVWVCNHMHGHGQFDSVPREVFIEEARECAMVHLECGP